MTSGFCSAGSCVLDVWLRFDGMEQVPLGYNAEGIFLPHSFTDFDEFDHVFPTLHIYLTGDIAGCTTIYECVGRDSTRISTSVCGAYARHQPRSRA
jgi:hypothetical protein